MDVHGKKVAIIVANYFEEAELAEPKKALHDAGAEVTVISSVGDELQSMQGDVNKSSTYQRDQALADADPSEYDAVVVPGGTVNADTLRQDEQAQQFVAALLNSGKPTAVICHGPWLLVSAGLVNGKRLTSFPSLATDIRNAGGEWVDEQVVEDGNLITSRNPNDIPAFNKALLTQLGA